MRSYTMVVDYVLQMVNTALANSSRKVPVKKIIVGINGEVFKEEWI